MGCPLLSYANQKLVLHVVVWWTASLPGQSACVAVSFAIVVMATLLEGNFPICPTLFTGRWLLFFCCARILGASLTRLTST